MSDHRNNYLTGLVPDAQAVRDRLATVTDRQQANHLRQLLRLSIHEQIAAKQMGQSNQTPTK